MNLVDKFKKSLSKLDSKQVVRRHILSGTSSILEENHVFQLKDKTADYFDVEYNEVVIVGSSKLGFSIAPHKRYRPFCDESDIDLAVISERLFKKVWKEIHLYSNSGVYWPQKKQFYYYLTQGWIRPDKLPYSKSFQFTNEWWSHFKNISSEQEYGPYKIRGGIYHSWFFFFQYQFKCIDQCRNELDNENISN